jgi:predicted transcriptional regulator
VWGLVTRGILLNVNHTDHRKKVSITKAGKILLIAKYEVHIGSTSQT